MLGAGPSMISTSSPRGRTTVAASGRWSPPAKTQAPASRNSSWKTLSLRLISTMVAGTDGSPTGFIALSR